MDLYKLRMDMREIKDFNVEDRLKKIGKENLVDNFENLNLYIKELTYIKIKLVTKEFLKLVKKYDDEEKRKYPNPNLRKGLVMAQNMRFEMNLELNLYIKSFMFVLRQFIDECLSIMHQLNFILRQDDKTGDMPKKDFTKFIIKLENGDLDYLEKDLLEFIKGNSIGLFKIRFLRNKLKQNNKMISNISFLYPKYVINLKYPIAIEERDEKLLQLFIEKGEIPSDIKEINIDLENMLDKYCDFANYFYTEIVSILYFKIKL